MVSAAGQLMGLELNGGWKVVSVVDIQNNSTGGAFSIGYIVKRTDGKEAFLKALDYSRAFRTSDPARALQALTEAFNFERDTLKSCSRLDRVVTALEDGSVQVSSNLDGLVQYLIFELADGNARNRLAVEKQFNLAWILRALHHVVTGLWQLHSNSIAHQDLKPSNVLVFKEGVSKISDLGRAALKGRTPPHEHLKIAGDPAYAPPELHYGYILPEWSQRRLGCDAYLFGSLVIFFLTGIGLTPQLKTKLHSGHSWENWSGTYEEVLPYVRDAFNQIVSEIEQQISEIINDASIASELIATIEQLCEPDPRRRGHPKNLISQSEQYLLERYVAKFDYLATKAEIHLRARIK